MTLKGLPNLATPARVEALGLPRLDALILSCWLRGCDSNQIAKFLDMREDEVCRRLPELRAKLKRRIEDDGHKVQRLAPRPQGDALPGRLTDEEVIQAFEGEIPAGHFEHGRETQARESPSFRGRPLINCRICELPTYGHKRSPLGPAIFCQECVENG